MACNSAFLRGAAWRAQPTRFCGLLVPVATAEDVLLFKLAAWRAKDIPDALAVFARNRDRLDTDYLRKWVAWFAEKNPCFQPMPARLDAVLSEGPFPPPERG
jgi:hypothetical protein